MTAPDYASWREPEDDTGYGRTDEEMDSDGDPSEFLDDDDRTDRDYDEPPSARSEI